MEVPSYTIEDVATFKGVNEDFCVEVRTVLRSTGRMSPDSETATACAQEDVSP